MMPIFSCAKARRIRRARSYQRWWPQRGGKGSVSPIVRGATRCGHQNSKSHRRRHDSARDVRVVEEELRRDGDAQGEQSVLGLQGFTSAMVARRARVVKYDVANKRQPCLMPHGGARPHPRHQFVCQTARAAEAGKWPGWHVELLKTPLTSPPALTPQVLTLPMIVLGLLTVGRVLEDRPEKSRRTVLAVLAHS